MQTKRRGRDCFAAFKLNMSKSYDRVEWHFFKKMMHKVGFDEQWVKNIIMSVSTVKYRIKVNGELTDPLSPYLFLLYAEAFSCLLLAS